MTENKRFTSDIHRIFDNDEEIACADTMDDAEILVDLLNEQDKEIKELEKENKQLQIEIMGQSEEIEILSDENKRLRCINKQLEERLDKSIALDMSQCGDVK